MQVLSGRISCDHHLLMSRLLLFLFIIGLSITNTINHQRKQITRYYINNIVRRKEEDLLLQQAESVEETE
jgi:hypothetical protein